MKITIDIDDRLLLETMALSARERKSLAELIEEGLRLRVPIHKGPPATGPLPIYRGSSGLAKGVDPTSNRSMMDAAGRRL